MIDENAALYKLEIFVPKSHFPVLTQALWEVDAGHIGNYDRCLSYSPVMSTWRALPGTKPFLGAENEQTEAQELKVEVTIRAEALEETMAAIRAVHPYEEAVVNVLPLLEIYRRSAIS